MRFLTRLTRRICKRVCPHCAANKLGLTQFKTELDALAVEEEEEPSYLNDLNAAPDFVDEAPVEETAVREKSENGRSAH